MTKRNSDHTEDTTAIQAVLDNRERISVIQGDCIEILRSMPDSLIDAVVTDPPYG